MFATKLQGASLFFLFAATYRLCVEQEERTRAGDASDASRSVYAIPTADRAVRSSLWRTRFRPAVCGRPAFESVRVRGSASPTMRSPAAGASEVIPGVPGFVAVG